jgi:hypothetical protein
MIWQKFGRQNSPRKGDSSCRGSIIAFCSRKHERRDWFTTHVNTHSLDRIPRNLLRTFSRKLWAALFDGESDFFRDANRGTGRRWPYGWLLTGEESIFKSKLNSNWQTLHTSPLLGKDWLLLRRIHLFPEYQAFDRKLYLTSHNNDP